MGCPYPWCHLRLCTPYLEFSAPVSQFVCDLGIFIGHKLSWSQHTDLIGLISNRTWSTAVSLGALGNSIHGISFTNWRHAFHAIIIPILTYDAPLWYTGDSQKSITQPLQVAQNAAIYTMCGVFHTTPFTQLHHFIDILPINLTLKYFSDSFKQRINRLSSNAVTCSILHSNPVALWPIT